MQALKIAGGVDPQGRTILLLGGGGVARAAGFALLGAGAKSLTLMGRTLEKVKKLETDLNRGRGGSIRSMEWRADSLDAAISECEIIVNATPLGMFPKAGECPLTDEAPLSTHHVVFDLVYNPLETRLIRMAKEAGSSTIVGIHMLVRQGALSFKLFTGQEPSLDVMRGAAINALRKGGLSKT